MRNNMLSFEDDQGSIFKFQFSGGDALDANFASPSGHLRRYLRKVAVTGLLFTRGR